MSYYSVMDLDDILPYVGDWNKYQHMLLWLVCLPVCIPCGFTAFNQVCVVYFILSFLALNLLFKFKSCCVVYLSFATTGFHGQITRSLLFGSRTCIGWLELTGEKRSEHTEIREFFKSKAAQRLKDVQTLCIITFLFLLCCKENNT